MEVGKDLAARKVNLDAKCAWQDSNGLAAQAGQWKSANAWLLALPIWMPMALAGFQWLSSPGRPMEVGKDLAASSANLDAKGSWQDSNGLAA